VTAVPFPDEWNAFIEANVIHDQRLSDELRFRLRKLIQVFIAEKNWEGCNGFAVSEEVKVTIAAQACVLVLGLQNVHFDHVLSILVYPDSYVAKTVETTRAGVIVERGHARLGEAWWRGPVILSWADVLAGGRRESPGRNLVFHEFAHQLDMMNGRMVDGTPPLKNDKQLQRWVEVLEPEYKQLVERCRQGHQGVVDCYGTTNVAEFFAVLTEVFFECPQLLSTHHPQVYGVLSDYFQLSPHSWRN
jgi:hypothetical protein